MSQAANRQPPRTDTLCSLYAPIREPLDEVEGILRRELFSDNARVDSLVKHGFRLGGKRLRPALVLFSAEAAGSLRPEHPVLAAALELIHTATLIHDDVLDEADLRRHLETVNARWDNETSILLGDYLVSIAISLAASVDGTTACREIGAATRAMCEGELRQIVSRGNYDLTEQEYLDIISGKTAELCACCCRLGAHYAGASDELRAALATYGSHLGMAFQIADDLLDVLGDETTTGKSLGTDLLKEKTTLPLIRLLDVIDAADRKAVLDALSGPDRGQTRDVLRPWLDRTDAIDYARRRANDFVERAIAELDAVPAGRIRDVMVELARYVIAREN